MQSELGRSADSEYLRVSFHEVLHEHHAETSHDRADLDPDQSLADLDPDESLADLDDILGTSTCLDASTTSLPGSSTVASSSLRRSSSFSTTPKRRQSIKAIAAVHNGTSRSMSNSDTSMSNLLFPSAAGENTSRITSLESENSSLRLLITSLKQTNTLLDSGASSTSNGGAAGRKQTMVIIENLRQSNRILTKKVEELAKHNTELQEDFKTKVANMKELAAHHADATDRLVEVGERVVEVEEEKKIAVGKKERECEGLREQIEALVMQANNCRQAQEKLVASETTLTAALAATNAELKATKNAFEVSAKAAKVEAAKLRKEKASQRSIAATLQKDHDESARISKHLREENGGLVGRNVRLKEEKERAEGEVTALRRAVAEEKVARKAVEAAMRRELEECKGELQRTRLAEKVAATKLKDVRKELGRSKTQLEGVQEQSGRVQINMKEYYSGEIMRLSEELESLGVQNVESGLNGKKGEGVGNDMEDDELSSEEEAAGEEEAAAEEEEERDSGGEGGENVESVGGGAGERRGSFFDRLFVNNETKVKEARERRLSSALDLVPEI